MVVEDVHGNRGLVPRVRASDFLSPCPPRDGRLGRSDPIAGRSNGAEVIHARCAGLDISKKDAKVCVRVAGTGRRKAAETVTTWSSMTLRILALRDHLAAEQVTCVVMEVTGDYWKPFYYLLENLPGVEVVLVNARHVKNLPGRKTDVADAAWLAQLGAHGLVRGSFVSPEPIRQLRDLTRNRTAITRERSRGVQRLEKLLGDAGIKLCSVATDIVGVLGRAMIEALIAGDHGAGRMADLAQRRMRVKIPQLTEALVGRFNDHHGFLARVHLNLIDQHTAVINQLTERIDDGVLSWLPRLDLHNPGDQYPYRRCHRGRDRRRHEPFPQREAPRVLGGHDPGEQRVRGAREVQSDSTGQPLPSGCPRGLSNVDRSHARHVPQREVQAGRKPPRTPEGKRRHPACAPRRDLAHGNNRHPLRRSRSRLLQPSSTGAGQTASHPPARSNGLPRHARPGLVALTAAASPWVNLRVRV